MNVPILSGTARHQPAEGVGFRHAVDQVAKVLVGLLHDESAGVTPGVTSAWSFAGLRDLRACRSSIELIGTIGPVTRAASFVSNRQNMDGLAGDEIRQVVGKPDEWRAPHGQLAREAVNASAGAGPPGNGNDGVVDSCKERETQARSPVLVPLRGLFEFSGRRRRRSERLGSPAGELIGEPRAEAAPGLAVVGTHEHTSGTSLELAAPQLGHDRGILKAGVLETGEQLGRQVGALSLGER